MSNQLSQEFLLLAKSNSQTVVLPALFCSQVPPKLNPVLKNHSVPLNSTFSTECVVSGADPEPKVNWTKDGKTLANTSNTITINHVTFNDEGQYRCYAENRAGKVNGSIWIEVTGETVILSNRGETFRNIIYIYIIYTCALHLVLLLRIFVRK